MVLVGEQYAQYLVIWHITPLGLLAKVVVVLLAACSLSFGNYFGCFQGTLFDRVGLGWRALKN